MCITFPILANVASNTALSNANQCEWNVSLGDFVHYDKRGRSSNVNALRPEYTIYIE